MKKYQIIYADPPWDYTFSHTRSARLIDDYKTLSIKQICKFKVKGIAEDNSILLMWITFPQLQYAFDVMQAWGFKYKTNAFTWIKLNKNKEPFWGMGYYTRSNAELCLLGKRGNGIPVKSHSVNSVILHPIMEHSKKPPLIRNKIVELFGDVSRIELFARKEDYLFECKDWNGWDVWGNEVKSDIDLKNLFEE